jgi:hypothetical protein
LFINDDISGNRLIVKDIIANSLTLKGGVHVAKDISGNILKINDITANNMTLKSFFPSGDISGNGLKVNDIISNNLLLRGGLNLESDIYSTENLYVRDITGIGLKLERLIVMDEISGNINVYATDISANGLSIRDGLVVKKNISGNILRVKDISANNLTLEVLLVKKNTNNLIEKEAKKNKSRNKIKFLRKSRKLKFRKMDGTYYHTTKSQVM